MAFDLTSHYVLTKYYIIIGQDGTNNIEVMKAEASTGRYFKFLFSSVE